ncbi:MAG: [acyl-carrier-protein] S-malonyltransferase [Candidatus Margulisiibacteriota bacterium]|nr:MAG: [acyl-carrier-protein] S-malonyltransferase [Candidatus Margulisbacteria bacterium GWD2_39_127]OGI01559.1 MAG: [acyl-carrier-protein] S-malonyltransferase [Candidatus Margulisbacteria bacterium GWF2_38_17]OGI10000.1 MAG: [acyl-carrier-protein] S-malonyltransferase [Candidatus Margulisbacteria bacterium GWE2_39_32]PZM78255.1 MAG: [acyl-carrier-protein] S-malonyltransferase [Candidatus Margulisiibacteriota bacterium]HAR61857.1 [acyl-carrier-protein] S-malonyltransferase [Candidatus Margul
MKTAFVFPGQGSQFVGMGKDLPNQEIFDQANNVLGFDLKQLCLNGPEDALKLTQNAQPAIFTVSYMQFKLQEVQPDIVAGHSLGEYTALCAAGVLDFETALTLIRVRGQLMEKAVPAGQGTMAAILGMDQESLKKVCDSVDGKAQIANYNSPGQIVISGTTDAIKKCCILISDTYGKKAIPLPVSGPFHSQLMKPAAEQFRDYLDKAPFNEPKIPIIMNVTADYLTSASLTKELLVKQLYSSVLWQQSIEKMLTAGVVTFTEIGPGKVLSGLINKIKKEWSK